MCRLIIIFSFPLERIFFLCDQYRTIHFFLSRCVFFKSKFSLTLGSRQVSMLVLQTCCNLSYRNVQIDTNSPKTWYIENQEQKNVLTENKEEKNSDMLGQKMKENIKGKSRGKRWERKRRLEDRFILCTQSKKIRIRNYFLFLNMDTITCSNCSAVGES